MIIRYCSGIFSAPRSWKNSAAEGHPVRGTPGRSLAPSSWLRGTRAQERVARPGLGPHNTQQPRGASTRGSCSVTDQLLVVTLDQSFKHHFERAKNASCYLGTGGQGRKLTVSHQTAENGRAPAGRGLRSSCAHRARSSARLLCTGQEQRGAPGSPQGWAGAMGRIP